MSETSGRQIELFGRSFIDGKRSSGAGETFRAYDPLTANPLEPVYHAALPEEVKRAAASASGAFLSFSRTDAETRARLLQLIADNLEAGRPAIVSRASLETGLPVARFEGELGRTCGQLKMFAEMLREGSWVDARIDRAQRDREPAPKPDVRSMLRPVGPVAIFCASNFPLAFSVAGGDTASALAAGCPVVVVGHASHPGTAELVAAAITEALAELELPPGTFSLVYQRGHEAGRILVQHPLIKAVGFTGSQKGGRALMDLAASRPEPIPVFAEMSSVNPVFVFEGALAGRGASIADGLFDSFTLGFGQFCTKPGLVFVADGPEATDLTEIIASKTRESGAVPLLNQPIRDSFENLRDKRDAANVATGRETGEGYMVPTTLQVVTLEEFLETRELSTEQFGPSTLIIKVTGADGFLKAAESLEGQLTATVHATSEEIAAAGPLLDVLERKAGRLIVDGFPTGVEVCDSMVHGGPYPATSDSRSTSVGTRSVERFCRLVAYQDFPDELLPDELKDSNPLGIERREMN